MYFILSLPRIISVLSFVRDVPEIILGGWAAGTFLSFGGGCFVDNVSEGWGISLIIRSGGRGGLTCPGAKAYLIHSGVCPGGEGSGSQNCPEGRGALTPCVSWG